MSCCDTCYSEIRSVYEVHQKFNANIIRVDHLGGIADPKQKLKIKMLTSYKNGKKMEKYALTSPGNLRDT